MFHLGTFFDLVLSVGFEIVYNDLVCKTTKMPSIFLFILHNHHRFQFGFQWVEGFCIVEFVK
jgi:hypothetical protein